MYRIKILSASKRSHKVTKREEKGEKKTILLKIKLKMKLKKKSIERIERKEIKSSGRSNKFPIKIIFTLNIELPLDVDLVVKNAMSCKQLARQSRA